jgi:spermidine synthase
MLTLNNRLALLLILVCCQISTCLSAEIVHSERSLYRNISVTEQGDLRCLTFHTKQKNSQQSCLLKSNPDYLVFNYTKLLLANLLVNPNPKRILIIGLGGGTLSNSLNLLLPESRIDNVELDPAVLNVARHYFSYLENEQINSITQDGRLFIKRALIKQQQYDLIILDAFNGDYIPEHLMTQEFLQECKTLLSDAGVLAANTFAESALYPYESATYQAVFGAFYNVKNLQGGNRIIIASKQKIQQQSLMLNANAWQHKLQQLGVDAQLLLTLMSTQQDWPDHARILTDQYSPANLLNSQ